MKLDSNVYKIKRNIQQASTRVGDLIGANTYKPGQYQQINLNVDVPNLGKDFHNYKIIQLSDIHLGYWMTPDRLEGLVSEVNALQPDLIVITGDYVSYIIDELLPDLYLSLDQLQAKDGVISVLGNHDHWMGAEKIEKVLSKAGITNLNNQVTTIYKSQGNLHIAGVDDAMVSKDDLGQVLELLPDDDSPAILLAHEPDFADQAASTGKFFLQLSGHSHGGQLSIPLIGTPFRGPWFKKYPVGKYQVKDMVQYTNRGVGTNAFRVRINCKPEITMITLKPTSTN